MTTPPAPPTMPQVQAMILSMIGGPPQTPTGTINAEKIKVPKAMVTTPMPPSALAALASGGPSAIFQDPTAAASAAATSAVSAAVASLSGVAGASPLISALNDATSAVAGLASVTASMSGSIMPPPGMPGPMDIVAHANLQNTFFGADPPPMVPTFPTQLTTIGGTPGTVITSGQVYDETGYIWDLPASVTIPVSGSINVTATAETLFITSLITSVVTPLTGWDSAISAGPAVPGAPTDISAAAAAAPLGASPLLMSAAVQVQSLVAGAVLDPTTIAAVTTSVQGIVAAIQSPGPISAAAISTMQGLIGPMSSMGAVAAGMLTASGGMSFAGAPALAALNLPATILQSGPGQALMSAAAAMTAPSAATVTAMTSFPDQSAERPGATGGVPAGGPPGAVSGKPASAAAEDDDDGGDDE